VNKSVLELEVEFFRNNLDFVMRVWITSSNNCRLFLEYDVHLDDSLMPDEQVR